MLLAAEVAQQATQTQTGPDKNLFNKDSIRPDKKKRLLLEVLVTASAHDILEVFGVVWVFPPVVVWSVVDQMSIMVVGGIFVTNGVSGGLFWDTSARDIYLPVTRAGNESYHGECIL